MKEKKPDLSYLYAALGTVAFFTTAIPILDAFSTWVCNLFGLQSVKLSSKAAEYSQEEPEQHTQCVGFQTEDEEGWDGIE